MNNILCKYVIFLRFKKQLWAYAFSFLFIFSANAYNLRRLSSKEGLSNSAILSICHDTERFMWFGSVDGLNVYNGVDIHIFKPNVNAPGSPSGNLIEEVREGEEGIIWINTNHGLNRYNKKTREIECFEDFEGKYYTAKAITNEIFVIHRNDTVHYYDKRNKKFVPISYPGIVKNEIQRIFIDNENVLWIVSDKGTIRNARVSFVSDFPVIVPVDDFVHDSEVRYAFMEKDRIYFIDRNYFLFEMEVGSCKKNLILNLKKEIEERGIVSSVIRDNDDFLVAFQTNGLLRLRNTPENEIKYKVEQINIYCGVFCLCKDEEQDIIWIGTDGQGVYMYTRDLFSIRSATFEHLPFSIRKPIRALFLDQYRNLWIGTKDDGILLIKDYYADSDIESKEINRMTTDNSALADNSIYAFGKSRRNLFWIGGDGPGLNYYSYRDKKIKRLQFPDAEPIRYVHTIQEVNDSVLWLASVGAGIFKVVVAGTNDEPVIKSVRRFTFVNDEMSYNYFFTSCLENDSILWFGNRGYGLRRLNLRSETFDEVRFYKKDIRTINDILSIYKDSKGNIWVGTSFGILKLLNYDAVTHEVSYENYNEIEGLPNNTIHGILEDNRGYLWLSTNGGVVRFDTEMKHFHLYNYMSGLSVFEFSDGAYLKDERTGTLFFGGTNGFVTISPDKYMKKEFTPQLFFTGLKIYENEYNLNDFIRIKNEKKRLQLRYDQNFFSISFIAPDYINGQNCKYYYNLENFNYKWIENGYSNVVNFTNVSPGEYILHVKCDNGDRMTDVCSLTIVILPPWYMTGWAYSLYVFLTLLLLFSLFRVVSRRYQLKRESIIEKMNQQQKEEIYESKLRFFTNITHEFSTPLTLIYGPCDRIISYEKSDSFVKKYAGMIMKNTEQLNSLIQELIEFRRIETGHKACVIERLNITEMADGIVDSFMEQAEVKTIDFRSTIERDVYWNSDKGCFMKIFTNLLSNAFKYTPDKGRIILSVCLKDELLEIRISNTGKGIREKDIPYVFDRYRVLEHFERQTQKGFFSRNGLGLAICHNMVKLLHGEIDVRSIPDEFTEFCVVLPPEVLTDVSIQNSRRNQSELPLAVSTGKSLSEMENNASIWSKPTVFVIDDDPEMCWFISEILNKQYHVISITNPSFVSEELEKIQPNLILSDIMMPELDGISLMKQIKVDPRTAHIPFILLSAKNTPEEQTEGIAAGAEAYIVKPFNVEYLQSIVSHLIHRQMELRDYYRSPISAFEFADGKFIHKENKELFERIMLVIDKNLTNTDFSAEQLAADMGLSSRHLYRKLKEITDRTPAELIREYRLIKVEKLLITSRHSVDEIMYKAGFNNRGSFYRLFSQKYGMSPKKYRESRNNRNDTRIMD